jgi:hypothetical protein
MVVGEVMTAAVGRIRFFRKTHFVVVDMLSDSHIRDTWTFQRVTLDSLSGRLRIYNLRVTSHWRKLPGWEEADVAHIVDVSGRVAL